jgi:murein DD-endopeptidase MepM/ murein hydrolase activator NlpD
MSSPRIAQGEPRSLASPLVRVGQLAPVWRVFVAICVVAAAAIPLLAPPAGGQPVPDPRQAGSEAAAKYSEIETRYDQFGDQIAALELKIQAGEARRAELRGIAQRRAAVAYKNAGADLGVLFQAKNPSEGVRSTALLDRANEADNRLAAELGTLNAQLTAQRDQLTFQQRERQGALNELNGIDANFAAAAAGGPVQVIDGMVCPVPGAAFTDDFGQPRSGGRSHQGVDMHAPMGIPELAVISGNVTYGDGGGGGMGAYIAGDDGNRYVYYHLSAYIGPPRHVTPGEVIGKLGATGDATGPHLHFEFHPGGGPAVDPYPLLAKICFVGPTG